jgi:hypothetical protein
VLKNTGYTGLDLNPSGIRHARNGGYAAINLAVHFGASRIALVGFDMGSRGGKVHCFGNHQGLHNPSDAQFHSFARSFKTLVEPLQSIGVEVVNCTPCSSLDAFPMGDLDDVLAPRVVAA